MPRIHSASSHPRSSRRISTGVGRASRCQAQTRSRAGSAGPRPPTSMIPDSRSFDTVHVPADQVTVGHHVGRIDTRCRAKLGPHPAQPGDVDHPFAAPKAHLDPRIVRSQVATSTGSREDDLPATSIVRTQRMNTPRSCANSADRPDQRRSPRYRAATSAPTRAAGTRRRGRQGRPVRASRNAQAPSSVRAACASRSSDSLVAWTSVPCSGQPRRKAVTDAKDRIDGALRGNPAQMAIDRLRGTARPAARARWRRRWSVGWEACPRRQICRSRSQPPTGLRDEPARTGRQGRALPSSRTQLISRPG